MILGVWISTKPLLVRVSLKSWHTPDCRRKMAWLVVVWIGGRGTRKTHTFRMICWINYTIQTDALKSRQQKFLIDLQEEQATL